MLFAIQQFNVGLKVLLSLMTPLIGAGLSVLGTLVGYDGFYKFSHITNFFQENHASASHEIVAEVQSALKPQTKC